MAQNDAHPKFSACSAPLKLPGLMVCIEAALDMQMMQSCTAVAPDSAALHELPQAGSGICGAAAGPSRAGQLAGC